MCAGFLENNNAVLLVQPTPSDSSHGIKLELPVHHGRSTLQPSPTHVARRLRKQHGFFLGVTNADSAGDPDSGYGQVPATSRASADPFATHSRDALRLRRMLAQYAREAIKFRLPIRKA